MVPNGAPGCRAPEPQFSSLLFPANFASGEALRILTMKIKNSIKTLRTRHRDNRVVRRRGRLYIINKTVRRYKARQG